MKRVIAVSQIIWLVLLSQNFLHAMMLDVGTDKPRPVVIHSQNDQWAVTSMVNDINSYLEEDNRTPTERPNAVVHNLLNDARRKADGAEQDIDLSLVSRIIQRVRICELKDEVVYKLLTKKMLIDLGDFAENDHGWLGRKLMDIEEIPDIVALHKEHTAQAAEKAKLRTGQASISPSALSSASSSSVSSTTTTSKKRKPMRDDASDQDYATSDLSDSEVSYASPSKSEESGAPKKKRCKKGSGSGNFLCTYDGCGKRFARNFNLKRHVNSVHTRNNNFTCSKDLLAQMMGNQHVTRYKNELERIAFCGKIFSEKHHALNHVFSHLSNEQGIYRYRCDICKKGWGDRSNLLRHMKTHQ